jgi:predicted DCC family thiol-disulfide oxidoreductase YuxK
LVFYGIIAREAFMSATTTETEIDLPTPAMLPNADVVIYDGDCNFCRSQVARLARWDGTGKRLAFISLHDPLVQERYPDLTYDMLMEQMYIVDQQGRRHAGAAAFRYLSGRLPILYALWPFLHIPFTLPLWQWGYKQVAKRRYKIMGKKNACQNGTCEIHYR